MMCRADTAEEDAVVVVVMVLAASVSREDMIRGVMSVAVAVGYIWCLCRVGCCLGLLFSCEAMGIWNPTVL